MRVNNLEPLCISLRELQTSTAVLRATARSCIRDYINTFLSDCVSFDRPHWRAASLSWSTCR